MADLANIGLSEDMRLKLKDMHEGGVFSEMKDGYRLAASIAIKFKFDVEKRDLPRRDNMYDVGGIDDNFIFRNAISEIFPEKKGEEYRHLEKLADAGVEYMYGFYDGEGMLRIDELLRDER
jgi:hypothetical protein